MGFMDFGLYQGLSVKTPSTDHGARFQQELEMRKMERQSKTDAENKAKLFTDDIEFGQASTEWGQGQLDEFYTKKLEEIGEYMIQNPDLKYNSAKMIQLKYMKSSLKNNSVLMEDLNFKTEHTAFTKWLQDNPDVSQDDPLVMEELAKLNNYKKYGSTELGSKERMQYTFVNPDAKVNIPKHITDIYSKVPQMGYAEDGTMYMQEVKYEDLYKAADLALMGREGKALMREWESLSTERKLSYSNDPKKYIADLGSSAITDPKIGNIPQPRTSGSGSGSGPSSDSDSGDNLHRLWNEKVINSANRNAALGLPAELSPEIIRSAFMSKEGTVNLSQGTSLLSKSKTEGEMTMITDKQAALLINAKATPDGNIYAEMDKGDNSMKHYTTFTIEMDPGMFQDYWLDGDPKKYVDNDGDQSKMHGDGGDNIWKWIGENDGRDAYTTKTIYDENGKSRNVFTFTVKKYIDPQSPELMGAFAKASHIGTQKADAFSDNSPGIDPAMGYTKDELTNKQLRLGAWARKGGKLFVTVADSRGNLVLKAVD